jgi:nitrous oxide reductase
LVNDSKGSVNDSKGSVNDSKSNKNKCIYCNKILSCKQSKSQHLKICKIKSNNQHLTDILKEENILLKEELLIIKNQMSDIINKFAKIHPKTLKKIN